MAIAGGTIDFQTALDMANIKKGLADLKKRTSKEKVTISVGMKLVSGALGAAVSAITSAFDIAKYSVSEFSKEMQQVSKTAQQYGIGMDAAAEALKTSEITGVRVKDLIDRMRDSSGKIPGHLQKTSDAMRRNAENATSWSMMLSDVNDQFKRIGGELLNVIEPAFPYIVQAAEDIGDMIQEYVIPVLGKMSNVIVNLWGNLETGTKFFMASARALEASSRSTAYALALNTMDVLKGALEGIKSIFGSFQSAASSTIKWLDEQIRKIPLIGDAYKSAGNTLDIIGRTASDLLGQKGDAVADAAGLLVGQTGQEVKDTLSGYVQGATDAAADAAKTAGETINNTWDKIYSDFEKAMNKANADYAYDMKEAGEAAAKLLAPPEKIKKWERRKRDLTDEATKPPRVKEKDVKIKDTEKDKDITRSMAGSFSGLAASQLAAQGPLEKINKEQLTELEGIRDILGSVSYELKDKIKPKDEETPKKGSYVPNEAVPEVVKGVGDSIRTFAKAIPSPLVDGLSNAYDKVAGDLLALFGTPGTGVGITGPGGGPLEVPSIPTGAPRTSVDGKESQGMSQEDMFKSLIFAIKEGFQHLSDVNSGSLMRNSSSSPSLSIVMPVQ
jgi:hypothetical protein